MKVSVREPCWIRWTSALGATAVLLGLAGCAQESRSATLPSHAIGSRGTAPGQFVQPRAIAAAPDGRVFVADKTGRVQRFSRAGYFELAWEMPDNRSDTGKPSGLCVDSAGRVWVADTHFSRVIVFDPDGAEIRRFGERGMGAGQFMLPTDVAVDSTGAAYVSEYGGNDRVSKFAPNGDYLFSFGDIQDGSAALQRPSGLAVDANDNLWVADASNHRICCFNPEGRLIPRFGRLGTEPGQLRYPRDVVARRDGSLLVVDYGNDRVASFDQRGAASLVLGAGWPRR